MYRQGAHFPFLKIPRIAWGILAVAANCVVLGTVSALWENPFFIRMTPAGNWEIFSLLLISSLLGLFLVVRHPSCSVRSAGTGDILGFLGIACPICNKLLMLLFGGEFLLTYFEPLRPYVASAGAALLMVVTGRELALRKRSVSDLRQNITSE